MTIGREGNTIRLVFVCDDEYLAIKLYDELTAQSDAGQIGLSLNVGPQASDCLRAITRKLEDLFRQDGVEVLTDYTRQEMGLPPRGPDGWTIEEIHAMERLRLERMMAPMPMFIPLSKAGTP
jgi:hypothetical protein